MNNEMKQKKAYMAPQTECQEVELENGFMVASGHEMTLKKDDVTIEVEDYATIENDVTFD